MRKIITVIPASGVGSRMNAPLPKQYLKLQGKTILEHTLNIFLEHPNIQKIIVAVSETDQYYPELSVLNSPKIQIVFGGETRADSVFNAIKVIDEDAWVLVHDAARPCLKRSDLDKLLQVQEPSGAILATPAIDTMKRASGNKIVATEDRSTLWHALTPQFFPVNALKHAIKNALEQGYTITDEASAMEMSGYTPQLITGRSDNLKITRPEDLALAEFYLTHYMEN
ncbi:2-C-methyl-D-erythritol 4-phosphate cytidylyltransferase [Actinobacillus ureae]|uniref:2-C-methyl-D-erythritol 4-phosphate cytidylyltransferase n=2 Tax=Actinobacillus ureae TaxID=723 RepID=E8KI93_9PAST|nr:2-C-methyl-D-erythritol 4-phosphate cytidylyltransferase [Actinobacillus ureae ATCC 25976]SSX98647.1 2-C-methyl-D-erythritol 4-phosphate cytidylyltransferase [Actinobacillus ureae]SUT86643.1 2-C-methyl-D-erythritol 4-phosphate cytidylyltransferase [Actinobacillus ureae]SUU46560.1 2-C-methyl-D-erythritol 4-phosphate cytidylyltransferase [Actinobacillus ureae]